MKMYLIAMVLVNSIAFAQTNLRGEVGNGGSANDAQLATQTKTQRSILDKIQTFFANPDYQREIKKSFPKVEAQEVVQIINELDIEVVNEELIDKDKKSRTCLNFPKSKLIRCNYNSLQILKNFPSVKFVLMLHEVLGITGDEISSPDDITILEGFDVSGALAKYVEKIYDYDLIVKDEQKISKENDSYEQLSFSLVKHTRPLFLVGEAISAIFQGGRGDSVEKIWKKVDLWCKIYNQDCQIISKSPHVGCSVYRPFASVETTKVNMTINKYCQAVLHVKVKSKKTHDNAQYYTTGPIGKYFLTADYTSRYSKDHYKKKGITCFDDEKTSMYIAYQQAKIECFKDGKYRCEKFDGYFFNNSDTHNCGAHAYIKGTGKRNLQKSKLFHIDFRKNTYDLAWLNQHYSDDFVLYSGKGKFQDAIALKGMQQCKSAGYRKCRLLVKYGIRTGNNYNGEALVIGFK